MCFAYARVLTPPQRHDAHNLMDCSAVGEMALIIIIFAGNLFGEAWASHSISAKITFIGCI